jgi:hypothetical protein
MTAIDRFLETCIHETGHALALLHFSGKFEELRAGSPDLPDGIHGQVTKPGGISDPFACAICALAGPILVQRLTGIAPADQSGSADDLAVAERLLSDITVRGEPLTLESIRPWTEHVIDMSWPMITIVAAHLSLSERKKLNFAEVIELLQSL